MDLKVGIFLESENFQNLKITKIMASQPRRVAEIKVVVEFPATRSFSPKERQLLEHAARTCPVALSLHPDLLQSLEFVYP